jgi:hypothetical protein
VVLLVVPWVQNRSSRAAQHRKLDGFLIGGDRLFSITSGERDVADIQKGLERRFACSFFLNDFVPLLDGHLGIPINPRAVPRPKIAPFSVQRDQSKVPKALKHNWQKVFSASTKFQVDPRETETRDTREGDNERPRALNCEARVFPVEV